MLIVPVFPNLPNTNTNKQSQKSPGLINTYTLLDSLRTRKNFITGKLSGCFVYSTYGILILITWWHVFCAICCCRFEDQGIPPLLIQSPNPKEELPYHVASPLPGSLSEKTAEPILNHGIECVFSPVTWRKSFQIHVPTSPITS